jgi:hypothetical protein
MDIGTALGRRGRTVADRDGEKVELEREPPLGSGS